MGDVTVAGAPLPSPLPPASCAPQPAVCPGCQTPPPVRVTGPGGQGSHGLEHGGRSRHLGPSPPWGHKQGAPCTADRKSRVPPHPQPSPRLSGDRASCVPWGCDSFSPARAQNLRATPSPAGQGLAPFPCGKWGWPGPLCLAPGPQVPFFLVRLLALSWGQGPGDRALCAHHCLQVLWSKKQRARGSVMGRLSPTHGWHLPPPAPRCPTGEGTPAASQVQTGRLLGADHPGSGRPLPPASSYLRELAPGDLGWPVALDHDGGSRLPGPLGAAGLVQQVVVRLLAGVQAPLPDLLVQPGVWAVGTHQCGL